MKRMIPVMTFLSLFALTPNLFAASTTSASTAAPKATAAQRKDALDTCKKEGKVGKQLTSCMKEKLSQNTAEK